MLKNLGRARKFLEWILRETLTSGRGTVVLLNRRSLVDKVKAIIMMLVTQELKVANIEYYFGLILY